MFGIVEGLNSTLLVEHQISNPLLVLADLHVLIGGFGFKEGPRIRANGGVVWKKRGKNYQAESSKLSIPGGEPSHGQDDQQRGKNQNGASCAELRDEPECR